MDAHGTASSRVKELVAHEVTLADPKQDYELCVLTDGVLMVMDKVWVPDANNLGLRICIVGHCGIAGHLCLEGTKRRFSKYFLWESFQEDIKYFCGS